MSFALATRNALRRGASNKAAYTTVFARTKVTLPDLDYDFGALEPYISGNINEVSWLDFYHEPFAIGQIFKEYRELPVSIFVSSTRYRLLSNQ